MRCASESSGELRPDGGGSNLADGVALAKPSVRMALLKLARIVGQRRFVLGEAGQIKSRVHAGVTVKPGRSKRNACKARNEINQIARAPGIEIWLPRSDLKRPASPPQPPQP